MAVLVAAWYPLAAFTAPVYKQIGPDGKVTYTDKRPADVEAQAVTNAEPFNPEDPSSPLDKPMEAAIKSLAWEVVVEAGNEFCRLEVPQSASKVKAARDEWMSSNSTLRSMATDVLRAKLSAPELRMLEAYVKQESTRLMNQVRSAPIGEKTKWCQEAPRKFFAPELSPIANPDLLDQIMRSHSVLSKDGEPQ